MSEVGEVKYKVVADDSDLDQQINKTEGKLKSKFAGAAKVVGAAAGAAVAAGSAAMISLVKQATTAYGEYEQLVGGVETLFGAGGQSLEEYAKSVGKTTDEVQGKYDTLMKAQNQVMQDASNAYKDAGLSANEYMEQVTSVAAALKQSSKDEIEAAEAANQAIIDMADNANKMGTPLENIQNAYAGFAKQNYTMLDNLKLGYGGTKQEMERLLADAQKLTGVKYDINSLNDVYAAIHAIQDELGITGTTADEAASTFQGSLSMMQAAWQNLVTGMADPDADISKLLDNVIESAKTFLNNLLPILSQALQGISQAIAEIAPVVAKELPGVINGALPGLLKAGSEVIQSLASGILSALPALQPTAINVVMDLIKMLVELSPQVVTVGIQMLGQLAQGIVQALPQLIPAAIDAVITITKALTDPSNIGMLVDASIAIILALANGLIEALPELIEQAPVIIENLITALVENAPKLVEAAIELVISLVKGIINSLPKLLEAAAKIVLSLVEGIINYMSKMFDVGKQAIEKIKEGLSSLNPLEWGKDLVNKFIEGIKSKISAVGDAVKGLANKVKSVLHFSEPDEGPLADFHTYAPDMMDLFAKGIDDNADKVENSIDNVTRTIAGAFTADVGYNLPDIAGYAADLSAAITATSSTEIIIPLSINGREIARASAWYMNEQLAWEAR